MHYADSDESELRRTAVVPLATPKRTSADCIAVHFAPDLVHQAVVQARRRGLISRDERAEILATLPGGADGS